MLWAGLCTALVAVGLAAEAGDAAAVYRAEIAAAREARVAQLTRPDGWLAYLGTHTLDSGANSIGRSPGSRVRLEAGPAQLGTLTVAGEGRTTFTFAPGVSGEIDGVPLRRGELKPGRDTGGGSVVTVGALGFFVLDRGGGQRALRAWDGEAPRRKDFAGIDYFPTDPAWRVQARWEAFETARFMPIPNIAGQTVRVIVPGRAVFERDGQRYELLAIDEGGGGPLLFVIADATSGKETYGACRFVYAERPRAVDTSEAGGAGEAVTIILDFNRAENPPCAFTPLAVCPLPPKENRLTLAVTAGEKVYRGAHE